MNQSWGQHKNTGRVKQAWNALRATLENHFSFNNIKQIVGLAGFNLLSIAHLEQTAGGASASKGQLMTVIDQGLNGYDQESQKRFIAIVAEEVLKRKPDSRQSLENNLSRLGWSLAGNAVIPIEIFDASILAELPSESQDDLIRAAQRLRDGNLSGAITSACGALDTTTSKIYTSANLGNPGAASFQERCKKAMLVTGVIPKLEKNLQGLGWNDADIRMFKDNFEKALNHGAYVMQTLRSKMGDVHGTKPFLKPLVFDCLKWAELTLRALNEK